MAIQMRRGAWSQFDPTKMLPGEWAVILSGHPETSNGQALYHCFAAGSVKQIATIEDAATIIANATEDIREELTQDIASALAQVGAATNAANTATANANTATSAANAATQAATSASDRAEDAIDAMGDISELAVPLMSPDVRGGAKLDESGGLALRDERLGIGSLVQESEGEVRGGLAEVTAKGHAEQDGTPTPDNPVPIQVVRGRNLLDESAYEHYDIYGADGHLATNANANCIFAEIEQGEAYCVTRTSQGTATYFYYGFFSDRPQNGSVALKHGGLNAPLITAPSGAKYVGVFFGQGKSVEPQLTLGSTPQPYVPYGHVGMEARDPDTDELISCTALPLPSRGWVAGLPDGTADSLRLDGAGKCEWELNDAEEVLDGSSMKNIGVSSGGDFFYYNLSASMANKAISENNPVMFSNRLRASSDSVVVGRFWNGNIIRFLPFEMPSDNKLNALQTWLITHNLEFLYPLATPVIEDCGYVEDWPTDLPEGATVTIPELDEVGVKYFIDSAVTELARQWYERANSEYADRLTALEQAVAELATS